jgi:hypothetical protein
VGTASDEIRRELNATRHDLDDKLDVLEGRARRAAKTLRPFAAIAAGVAVSALASGYLIYRSRRKPTARERISARLPKPVIRLRDAAELRLRRGIPPTRIYVGDRRLGEEPPGSGMQKIGIKFAQSAGAAAGSAIVAYGLRSITKPKKAA